MRMRQGQMDSFKEFLGKDLDDCIGQALEYYGCPRENLEVEIVQDAKSGIFGIVGARKAKIRARRTRIAETVASLLNGEEQEQVAAPIRQAAKAQKKGRQPAEKSQKQEDVDTQLKKAPHKRQMQPGSEKAEKMTSKIIFAPERPERRVAKIAQPQSAPLMQAAKPGASAAEAPDAVELEDAEASAWPVRAIEELDQNLLEEKALEIVAILIKPIAGREIALSMDIASSGPRIHVDWEGDAGLIIGRDGQTLAAVQYLASRMLSRVMGAALRVQLDIGNYRARQDDRLREMAKVLADKVRHTGRPFSTKPLSSYHRRVIHLYLQDNEDVQTRSVGDGPQKRVLITPRRSCQQ